MFKITKTSELRPGMVLIVRDSNKVERVELILRTTERGYGSIYRNSYAENARDDYHESSYSLDQDEWLSYRLVADAKTRDKAISFIDGRIRDIKEVV